MVHGPMPLMEESFSKTCSSDKDCQSMLLADQKSRIRRMVSNLAVDILMPERAFFQIPESYPASVPSARLCPANVEKSFCCCGNGFVVR